MTKLAPKNAQFFRTINEERQLQYELTYWLKNLPSERSQNTYRAGLKQFINFSKLTNVQSLLDISELDVVAFRDHLRDVKKQKNRTVNNRLTVITSFLDHCIERGLIKNNVARLVIRLKVNESVGETPAMTNEQVRHFLKQPDTRTLKGARDSAILHFLFHTGTRIGAPGSIKIKDFYQDRGCYVIKWRSKGGHDQQLPVVPILYEALQHYLSQSEHKNEPESPLFAPVKLGNNNGINGLLRGTFYKIWTKYRVQAELPEQFAPHSARATFATVADENGVPIQDIQTALGHASVTTTQTYVKNRKENKDSAVWRVNY